MKPRDPSDPDSVGSYRVLARLGQGGMGRVLLGAGPDGRLVALKLVHSHFIEDQEFQARFQREVTASRAVSGAYTAAVVDADPDARPPWLASVFVPGPTLTEVLRKTSTLPESSVLRLAAGLASALTHIHQAKLIHRDLKPSNVLLTEDGVRVIDFGIVRAITDEQVTELTRTGILVGTPEFMSPEQINDEPTTPASDVFSFASIVVTAYTGTSPFASPITKPPTREILNNVARAEPDLSALPEAIQRIVRPCFAKNPAHRPSPDQLRELIGTIPPSAQPWPAAVHQLISQRQAKVAEFLGTTPPKDFDPPTIPTRLQVTHTGAWTNGPLADSRVHYPPPQQHAAPVDSPPSKRPRPRAGLIVLAIVAGLAALGASFATGTWVGATGKDVAIRQAADKAAREATADAETLQVDDCMALTAPTDIDGTKAVCGSAESDYRITKTFDAENYDLCGEDNYGLAWEGKTYCVVLDVKVGDCLSPFSEKDQDWPIRLDCADPEAPDVVTKVVDNSEGRKVCPSDDGYYTFGTPPMTVCFDDK